MVEASVMPRPGSPGCIFNLVETIGAPELIIVLVVVLLVFGSKKVPELARSLGESMKEFRKGARDGAKDDREGV